MRGTQGIRQAAEYAHRLYPASQVQKGRDPNLKAATKLALSRLEIARRKWAKVMVGIWRAGAELGADQASEQLGVANSRHWDDFWDTWEPGSKVSADQLRSGGLQRMLDDAGHSIQRMSDTMIDRLANTLADSLESGDNLHSTIRRMNEELGKVSNAELIARTEMSRAANSAALERYSEAGLSHWEWEASTGSCRLCLEREAGGPYAFTDLHPPLHPSCRCSVLAYLPF